jgi:hydrogenase maturation protein HypF
MLPYAPLHYLLLEDKPLVMTSGNLSEEPIVWRNEDAVTQLGGIADAFLMHDRDIHVPCDDSVVTVYRGHDGGHELPIRRSRGYGPMPVKLPVRRPMTLAVGAELKACFCLTRGEYAYMSQHIGDMENLETVDAFARALQHMQALFRCQPERVVCDSHPGYLSTRWARTYAQQQRLPLVEAQHHHAHAMSLMAEHGLPEDATALVFAFDGTGYGTDGAIWGGEVLLARYQGFQRLAHLKYTPLPGGDSAIRHPARVALAHLFAAGIEWSDDLPCVQACTAVELRVLRQQLTAGTHSVPSSSMGRLFDAVAAFLGLCRTVSYEGQAAIELEALCARFNGAATPYAVAFGEMEFDVTPMWEEMTRDLRAGSDPVLMAARFHHTICDVILHYGRRVREEFGVTTIGMTGGVFQNIYLLNAAVEAVEREGLRVLTHGTVPPNDGGIALGQAVIAG